MALALTQCSTNWISGPRVLNDSQPQLVSADHVNSGIMWHLPSFKERWHRTTSLIITVGVLAPFEDAVSHNVFTSYVKSNSVILSFKQFYFQPYLERWCPRTKDDLFSGRFFMQPGIGGLDPDQITSKLRSDIRSHGDSTNLVGQGVTGWRAFNHGKPWENHRKLVV